MDRLLSWECPACGEPLRDPQEDRVTQCHSGHEVDLFYDAENDRLIPRLVEKEEKGG